MRMRGIRFTSRPGRQKSDAINVMGKIIKFVNGPVAISQYIINPLANHSNVIITMCRIRTDLNS